MNTEKKPLPEGQRRFYVAILQHWAKYATSPSFRDLMKACNIASPNGIRCHLRPLIKKGWIVMPTAGLARSIIPTELCETIKASSAILLEIELEGQNGNAQAADHQGYSGKAA